MLARPIVLLGSERVFPVEIGFTSPRAHFDGRVGVWRDKDGRLAIQGADAPGTKATATREGVDQSDASVLGTYNTKTREGTDQIETTDRP